MKCSKKVLFVKKSSKIESLSTIARIFWKMRAMMKRMSLMLSKENLTDKIISYLKESEECNIIMKTSTVSLSSLRDGEIIFIKENSLSTGLDSLIKGVSS
jgi:hypothetical protein